MVVNLHVLGENNGISYWGMAQRTIECVKPVQYAYDAARSRLIHVNAPRDFIKIQGDVR